MLLCGGNPRAVRQRTNERGISPEHVQHACQRSLDNSWCPTTMPYCRFGGGRRPRQAAWTFGGLDQHEYWIDALRIPHLISDRWDTTNSYLLELIEFLVTHADRLLNGYHRYQPIQDKEPRQWMETVLMRGLRDEMRTRAL